MFPPGQCCLDSSRLQQPVLLQPESAGTTTWRSACWETTPLPDADRHLWLEGLCRRITEITSRCIPSPPMPLCFSGATARVGLDNSVSWRRILVRRPAALSATVFWCNIISFTQGLVPQSKPSTPHITAIRCIVPRRFDVLRLTTKLHFLVERCLRNTRA